MFVGVGSLRGVRSRCERSQRRFCQHHADEWLQCPGLLSGGGGTVVFEDNFETNLGWQTNPNATDTAVSGAWERGDPEATDSSGSQTTRHDDQRFE